MIKTFRRTKDYTSSDFDLNKGDIFKVIDKTLVSVQERVVYHYVYLIYVPKHNHCFILDGHEWRKLVSYSEYLEK